MLNEILNALKKDPVDQKTIESYLCRPGFDELLKGPADQFSGFLPHIDKIIKLQKEENSAAFTQVLRTFFFVLKSLMLTSEAFLRQHSSTHHHQVNVISPEVKQVKNRRSNAEFLLQISTKLQSMDLGKEFIAWLKGFDRRSKSQWQANYKPLIKIFTLQEWKAFIDYLFSKRQEKILENVFDKDKYITGSNQDKINAVIMLLSSRSRVAIETSLHHVIDGKKLIAWFIDIATSTQDKLNHIISILASDNNEAIEVLCNYKVEGKDLLKWFLENTLADKNTHISKILASTSSIIHKLIKEYYETFFVYLFLTDDKTARIKSFLSSALSANEIAVYLKKAFEEAERRNIMSNDEATLFLYEMLTSNLKSEKVIGCIRAIIHQLNRSPQKLKQHCPENSATENAFILVDSDPTITPQPQPSNRKRSSQTLKKGRKREFLAITTHLNDAGYEGEFKKYLTEKKLAPWESHFTDIVSAYPPEKWRALIQWFLMKKNDDALKHVFDVQKYLDGESEAKINAIGSIFRSKCDSAINPMMTHFIGEKNILQWFMDVAVKPEQKFEHVQIVLSCRKNIIINQFLDFEIEGKDLLSWFIEHPQADKSTHIETILCCNCSNVIRKILEMQDIFLNYLFSDKDQMHQRLHKVFSANLSKAKTIDRLKNVILKALDEKKISLSDFNNLFQYSYDNHQETAQKLENAIKIVLDYRRERANYDGTVETCSTSFQTVTTLDGLEFFLASEHGTVAQDDNSFALPPLLNDVQFDLQDIAQNETTPMGLAVENDFILLDQSNILVNSENDEDMTSTSRVMRNAGNNRGQRFSPYNIHNTPDDGNRNSPPSVTTFSLFNTVTTSITTYLDPNEIDNHNNFVPPPYNPLNPWE